MSDPNIEAIYRLSALQEGLLFHTLENPSSGVYFQQYSVLLNGALDIAALDEAWQAMAARHGVLRTLFTWEGRDKPLQIVRRSVTIPLEVMDWRDADGTEQTRRLDSFLRRDRDRGFDLARAPLTRVALIHNGDDRHRMVWSFHHLLIDGWSMRLLVDELLAVYQQRLCGTSVVLADAPTYADFIAGLEHRDAAGDAAFFAEQLRGFRTPTCPDLGAPARVAAGAAARKPMRARRIDDDLYARLTDLARRERLTVNTLVVGAWALLLARYCDSDDVVFGTTVAGRPLDLPGIERTAGLFINTLPLRVRVDDAVTLRDMLRAVQVQQTALRAHEQTPLVDVQRASEVPAGRPLFETIVVFENFPTRDAATGDAAPPLTLSDERFVEYSHFPLALLAVPGASLTLFAVHDPQRFGEAAILRLLTQLDGVLDELSQTLATTVGRLDVLSAGERHELIDVLAGRTEPRPELPPVHRLFERCAAASPDAIAIATDDAALTYGALNARANRIAHALIAQGATRGEPVVVYAERDSDAIAAVLGVLKAGAAYVPCDARHPLERLQQVLDDLAGASGPPLLITQAALATRLAAGAARVLVLNDEREQAQHNPERVIDGKDLAYVMYTSGSTGRPKGVMIRHANLTQSTLAREGFYAAAPRAFLLLSSLATDSSVAGLFWTLTCGATLVVPGARAEQDIEWLGGSIERHAVSHILSVPSLYALILENADPARLKSLAAVIVAGEACPPALIAKHRETLPGTALFNEYGPTEGTVWVSAARLDDEDEVTIGRPLPNTRLYVLDRRRRPLPLGVAGELYIGGAQVAAGYWRREALTRTAFVADPFSKEPGARLYRSGDRARWRADGQLEFLGRADDQIKVRGYRVEPGEVETALTQHPDVDEAVVVLHDPQDEHTLARALEVLGDEQALALLAAVETLSDEQVATALAAGNDTVMP